MRQIKESPYSLEVVKKRFPGCIVRGIKKTRKRPENWETSIFCRNKSEETVLRGLELLKERGYSDVKFEIEWGDEIRCQNYCLSELRGEVKDGK